jgi:co-chaperonin GroES (HSP10)
VWSGLARFGQVRCGEVRDVKAAVGDHLVVRRDGSFMEAASTSGIIIVEDRPQIEVGTVLATGPHTVDVEAGDRVIYDRYAGEDVYDHETDWVVLAPHEVLAKVVE